jgi:hypothetical protein
VSAGDCLFGAEDLDDSPSHLWHYINRWVGVKLPQHFIAIALFCCQNIDQSRSLFAASSTEAIFFAQAS